MEVRKGKGSRCDVWLLALDGHFTYAKTQSGDMDMSGSYRASDIRIYIVVR